MWDSGGSEWTQKAVNKASNQQPRREKEQRTNSAILILKTLTLQF